MPRFLSSARSRRVLILSGVVIATVVGGGALQMADADISSGDRAAFVPVAPCRLFDTRSDQSIGPRTTALGPGDAFAQTVRGVNGLCNIPIDATAVALNVTIVNPTAASYLTIWPSDAPQPLASNLNWLGGDPPTPNKVDVKMSADGRISFFNFAGSVDILADVVGYYANHNHDDRYYLKAQIDAALDIKADQLAGATQVVIDSSAFQPDQPSDNFYHDFSTGYASVFGGPTICVVAAVAMPGDVSITTVDATVYDGSASTAISVSLYRNPRGSASPTLMAVAQTGVAATRS